MKQEKLCEIEDMADKDYSRWYGDPVEQQKFQEELGAENVRLGFKSAQLEETPPQAYQIGGTHYIDMPIQPWDVVDKGPKEQAIGFYRYNALKYIMRAGEKGPAKEDFQKALHYLEKLIEIL